MSFFSFMGGAPKTPPTGGTTPPLEEDKKEVDAQYELGAQKPDIALDSDGRVLTPGDLEEEKKLHETPDNWREQQ